MADAELPEDLERLRVRLARDEDPPTPPWSGETEFPGIRAQTLVSDVYFNWGDHLDPVSAVNILATLAEAAGANTYAAELLGKMWRHIKDPQQRSDPAFLRYSRLFGRELVERALLGPSATALGVEEASAGPAKTGATAFDLWRSLRRIWIPPTRSRTWLVRRTTAAPWVTRSTSSLTCQTARVKVRKGTHRD